MERGRLSLGNGVEPVQPQEWARHAAGLEKSSVLLVAALCVYSVDAVSPFLLSVSWGRDPVLYSSGNCKDYAEGGP